ncbi:heparinase II/III family protein [uncultured Paracoccus sp.]|uniref:heparinase II/III family protein n=1 Tax=uncultured Paracoccus sp. TaxID=189685 RepID=UPI0025D75D2A|nr:heparinase II/III family protein [uncultured Paracoccus sp.]
MGVSDEYRPDSRLPRWPEPRAIGQPGRGRRILEGTLTLAGQRLTGDPFACPDLPLDCLIELHGFAWLDDLAAVAGGAARDLARRRVMGWIAAHPDPVPRTVQWLPEVAACRLLRWLFHAGLILPGSGKDHEQALLASMHRHLGWISDGWSTSPDGLARILSLSALFIGAAHLQGGELARLALLTLAEESEAMGLDVLTAPRSPEGALEALSCLTWAAETATATGSEPPPALQKVRGDLAGLLRGLRHADGGLPQFHGSGRGDPGRLDHALAAAPGPAATPPGQPLGYARMARGRTTLVLDAAPPPAIAADRAHASALGIELVVARQPLVVGTGSGARIGPPWSEASRRTHCHSTLSLAGLSSSHFRPGAKWPEPLAPDLLDGGARNVWAGDYDDAGDLISTDCGRAHSPDPAHLLAAHDGWQQSHGLTHLRELWLAPGGHMLRGEDSLAALDPAARARLAGLIGEEGWATGIGFDIRFHLHPQVVPQMQGDGLRLALPGGDWLFGHDGTWGMRLEPSAWLDPAQGVAVPSRQIVLSGLLTDHAVQIGWTFARAEGS